MSPKISLLLLLAILTVCNMMIDYSSILYAEDLDTNISGEAEIKTIQVDGIPFDAGLEEQISPQSHENISGSKPHIVTFPNKDGSLAVCWDDSANNIIHITEINQSFELTKDVILQKVFPIFGGFTKDDKGNYYVVLGKNNQDGDFESNVKLLKLDSEGREIGVFNLLTDKSNFDVMSPLNNGTSRVVYGDRKIAVHMGKMQHKNVGDGLNHQWAILFVVNSESMALDKDLSMGWTTSHSFQQRLIYDGSGFVNLDLGDGYPRGFNITKNKQGKVIFTYKTKHRDQVINGIPSGKSSNDNRTYSELGGLAMDSSGYVVLGASEKSFDNSKIGLNLNDSRNLFMLLVAHDFDGKKDGIIVNGDYQNHIISPEVVISNGESSKQIEFYDYGGRLKYQKRIGVVWLTDFKDKDNENVLRPKLVKLADNKYIALWEKWTSSSYITTQYMMFDAQGNILKDITDIGKVRLNREDDVVCLNGKATWVIGDKNKKQLKIVSLNPTISMNSYKPTDIKASRYDKYAPNDYIHYVNPVVYEITHTAMVTNYDVTALTSLEVNVPLPQTWPEISVYDVKIECDGFQLLQNIDGPGRIVRSYLLGDQLPKPGETKVLKLNYKIKTSEVKINNSLLEKKNYPPYVIDDEYLYYTQPKPINADHPFIVKKAEELKRKSGNNPYKFARLTWGWGIAFLADEKPPSDYIPDPASTNQTDHLIMKKWKDCGAHTTLFTALCRAGGVPARPVAGCFSRENSWHCWAEFYLPEVGWIPVETQIYNKEGFIDFSNTYLPLAKTFNMRFKDAQGGQECGFIQPGYWGYGASESLDGKNLKIDFNLKGVRLTPEQIKNPKVRHEKQA
ncbi:TPA: transglutaminase domain-containing protein, partial [bacterium]|nr:transglutaminase domain-containing protein [bacterium]